jgi:SAM-dependent methyltransferase
MTKSKASFAFGKNWEAFVNEHFTDERVFISKEHLLRFIGLDSLTGKYFLDVGCGSGLSSLAALRAGAARIISFDVDEDSVATTKRLWEWAGCPSHWMVLHGSALDPAFLATLPPADILYSWGVLHHTGALWQAIENVLPLVKRDGVFYVALYTTTPESPFWIGIKREYNASSEPKKRAMEAWYIWRSTIWPMLRAGQNPIKHMVGYKRSRGMEFLTDVRDWLGGWPYEDATVEEVQAFFHKRGFRQINIKTGEANTEYLFAPGAAQNSAKG